VSQGPSGKSGPTNPFGRLSADLYQQWERSMTAWWDRVLDSPDVLKALNGNLAAGVGARRGVRSASNRVLESMQLPTRDDLIRLTRIATLLEERLLSLEDRLLDMQDKLGEVEKEAIRARVEAAETRLTLEARLQALEARLGGEG
jgi:hypothetical protein